MPSLLFEAASERQPSGDLYTLVVLSTASTIIRWIGVDWRSASYSAFGLRLGLQHLVPGGAQRLGKYGAESMMVIDKDDRANRKASH